MTSSLHGSRCEIGKRHSTRSSCVYFSNSISRLGNELCFNDGDGEQPQRKFEKPAKEINDVDELDEEEEEELEEGNAVDQSEAAELRGSA